MAKHRQLMERWRKWKIKQRRTRPKAFSSKSMGGTGQSGVGHMRDGGANAYGHRARSFMGTDLLELLFTFPSNLTLRSSEDPWLNVQGKLDLLKQADPIARVLQFNCIYLDGHADTERSVRFFFGGRECFLVEKNVSLIRRTIIYTDIERAKRLHDEGRLKWLPYQTIRNSS